MLDANLRHLPINKQCFIKVHHCATGSFLHDLGVRNEDIMIATMLEKSHRDPAIMLCVPSGEVVILAGSQEEYWLVYEGAITLRDFINEESRTKAAAILAKGNRFNLKKTT